MWLNDQQKIIMLTIVLNVRYTMNEIIDKEDNNNKKNN